MTDFGKRLEWFMFVVGLALVPMAAQAGDVQGNSPVAKGWDLGQVEYALGGGSLRHEYMKWSRVPDGEAFAEHMYGYYETRRTAGLLLVSGVAPIFLGGAIACGYFAWQTSANEKENSDMVQPATAFGYLFMSIGAAFLAVATVAFAIWGSLLIEKGRKGMQALGPLVGPRIEPERPDRPHEYHSVDWLAGR